MKNSKFAALIPMKGHSERIPNKNIRDFGGKPLFYWIINSLYRSPHIGGIFVDTDSKFIGEECKKYFSKVNIINRPEKLRGDFVSMNKIIAYDLSQIKNYSYFIQSHATNPLITTEIINRAINEFFKNINSYDSLFTVTKFQSRFYDYKGRPINHNPNKLIRTQDLKPMYEENSNLYLFKRDVFLRTKKRIGNKPILFEVDKIHSADIDTEEDFQIASASIRSVFSKVNNNCRN